MPTSYGSSNTCGDIAALLEPERERQLTLWPDAAVAVHQVVRSLDGDVLADSTVHHVYRLRDGLVEHMEIRR